MVQHYDFQNILRRATELVGARGQVFSKPGVGSILLVPSGAGLPIVIHIYEDEARIWFGGELHLGVANNDPGDDETVIEVLDAIMRGNIEQHFGIVEDGTIAEMGNRVWYERGEQKSDYDQPPIAIFRLPAWS